MYLLAERGILEPAEEEYAEALERAGAAYARAAIRLANRALLRGE